MDIRKSDSKGRVVVGEKGQIYNRTVLSDGTISLTPITRPETPVAAPGMMDALYVNFGGASSTTLTLVSSPYTRDMVEYATFVEDIANRHAVPVVINNTSLGGALFDLLENRIDAGLLGINPNVKD